VTADSGLDVFVSYAHADNGVAVGSSVPHGWVTALASNLNEGPNVFKKRFFIDHQLRPGDDFSADLLTKVESSSLLVLLLSDNYIDSQWCGRELEHFVRTHSANPAAPRDVFVVELCPYEKLVNVPAVIQQLRKRLIHAKFWYQPRDAATPSLAGYPSAMECGAAGRDHYWSVINELRGALDTRLRELRAQRIRSTGAVAAPVAAPAVPHVSKTVLGTVLLADVTDDLEAQRTAVRLALEPEGIVVLPEGDYVGLTSQEFSAAVTADLARADLFVQLLSPTSGRKARGFDAPLPQLQYQRAVGAHVPILQWCERLPTAGQLTDAAHADLFKTEFLRATHLAEFKTSVIERLRSQRALRDRAAAATAAVPDALAPRSPKRWIFVDDAAGEPLLSDRLRTIIRQQNCTVRSLPAGAPLGNNGIDVKELLRPCRAGITIYADRAKYATAFNRLMFFLNQVADGSLPLARWGVVLQQGTVASEFGIESDEVVPIDEHSLAGFLSGL
jgi:TIR domain